MFAFKLISGQFCFSALLCTIKFDVEFSECNKFMKRGKVPTLNSIYSESVLLLISINFKGTFSSSIKDNLFKAPAA